MHVYNTVRYRCVGWCCSVSASYCTLIANRNCTVSCFTCCRAPRLSSPSTRSRSSSQALEPPSCYSASLAATAHALKASASCGWSVSQISLSFRTTHRPLFVIAYDKMAMMMMMIIIIIIMLKCKSNYENQLETEIKH